MRLLVVGAGPKAIAIAAKAHVLREAGWETPDVLIVEKHQIANNWTGNGGFTHGKHPLGTPPEKDVGFPYESSIDEFDPTIDVAMLAYSWSAYKIGGGTYAEWVDRGRPQPRHKEWANYFKWVAERVHADVRFGTVKAIERRGARWRISSKNAYGRVEYFEGDGLVMTGPGEPEPVPRVQRKHPRIFDGRDFWKNLRTFSSLPEGSSVAIIGGGETAASVAVALSQAVANRVVSIRVINRHGCLFSRGESFDENRLYSNPANWPGIPSAAREEIIRRTDRGVFSVSSKAILDLAENVKHSMIDVREVRIVQGLPHVVGSVGKAPVDIEFDYLIDASGFNPLWFVRMMGAAWRRILRDKTTVSQRIQSDLSVKGVSPRLHLPMLAAITQGPGFPNLSCLGHLSDRILSSYVRRQTKGPG